MTPRSTHIEILYTTYLGRWNGAATRLRRGEVWVVELQCDDGVVSRTRYRRLSAAERACESAEAAGLTVTIERCLLPIVRLP